MKQILVIQVKDQLSFIESGEGLQGGLKIASNIIKGEREGEFKKMLTTELEEAVRSSSSNELQEG